MTHEPKRKPRSEYTGTHADMPMHIRLDLDGQANAKDQAESWERVATHNLNMVKERDLKIAALTKQRDDLLAALERIARSSSSTMSRTYALEAIASVKGQQ